MWSITLEDDTSLLIVYELTCFCMRWLFIVLHHRLAICIVYKLSISLKCIIPRYNCVLCAFNVGTEREGTHYQKLLHFQQYSWMNLVVSVIYLSLFYLFVLFNAHRWKVYGLALFSLHILQNMFKIYINKSILIFPASIVRLSDRSWFFFVFIRFSLILCMTTCSYVCLYSI